VESNVNVIGDLAQMRVMQIGTVLMLRIERSSRFSAGLSLKPP
jgi:hypothetical protein